MSKKETVSQEIKKGDFDNVIFIGIQGKERNEKALELFTKEFPDKHVYMMDKEIYHNTAEAFVRKHIAWKEEQDMKQFVQNPDNLKRANALMQMFFNEFEQNWFTVKEIVEQGLKLESNDEMLDYKTSTRFLDILFAFGYTAYRDNPDNPKQKQYRIIKDAQARLKYMRDLIEDMKKDLKHLEGVEEKMLEEAKAENHTPK
jgi:hypothetical protein